MEDQIKKEIKSLILSKTNESGEISDSDYQEILNKVFELGVDPVEFKKLLDSIKNKGKVPKNKIVKNNSDLELSVAQEKIKSKEIEVNYKKKNSKNKTVLIVSFFIMSLAVFFVFKEQFGFKKNNALSAYYNIISYSLNNDYKNNNGHRSGNINGSSRFTFYSDDPEIEVTYTALGYTETEVGDLEDLILETNCGLSNCESKFDFSLKGRWNCKTSGSGDFLLNLDKEGFLRVTIFGDGNWMHWTEMYLYEYTRILEIVNALHKEQRGTDYYDIRKEYYDNGNIKNILVVDNYARDYYRNGQLKMHTTFAKNSEKIVSIKEYSKDGQLIDPEYEEYQLDFTEEDIIRAEEGDWDEQSEPINEVGSIVGNDVIIREKASSTSKIVGSFQQSGEEVDILDESNELSTSQAILNKNLNIKINDELMLIEKGKSLTIVSDNEGKYLLSFKDKDLDEHRIKLEYNYVNVLPNKWFKVKRKTGEVGWVFYKFLKKKTDREDVDMESLISEYLKAEDDRNFNKIIEYYDIDNMSRYWNLNYPSIEKLRNAYDEAWSISANSKNHILSINKLNSSTFDTYIKYTFYNIKNKEWKTSNTVVRFVFGQNNKIVEIYGKSID